MSNTPTLTTCLSCGFPVTDGECAWHAAAKRGVELATATARREAARQQRINERSALALRAAARREAAREARQADRAGVLEDGPWYGA